MRFAERFLILFALISIGLRLSGVKDGITLELIAMPLLALFYLLATPFILHKPGSSEQIATPQWILALINVMIGVGVAYVIIDLMLYTLNWLPWLDMAENSGLILVILFILMGVRYSKTKQLTYRHYLLRLAILSLTVIIACFLPFHNR
jgi:hypothetical protein